MLTIAQALSRRFSAGPDARRDSHQTQKGRAITGSTLLAQRNWLRARLANVLQSTKLHPPFATRLLAVLRWVPAVRLELTRALAHTFAMRARLPVPPRRPPLTETRPWQGHKPSNATLHRHAEPRAQNTNGGHVSHNLIHAHSGGFTHAHSGRRRSGVVRALKRALGAPRRVLKDATAAL